VSGTPLAAPLLDFRVDLAGGDLLSALQLIQADSDLLVELLAEHFSVLATLDPLQEGLGLRLIQVSDFLDGNFNVAHGKTLSA